MRKKKQESRKAFVPITINKSTLIINAIGHPSATAQKIFNMALRYIETDPKYDIEEKHRLKEIERKTGVDYSSGIVSRFKQSDFLRLIPGRNSAWKTTRDELFNRNGGLATEYIVNIPDPKGQYTAGFTQLIIGAYYDENTNDIYIKFQDSELMRSELLSLSGYTKLTLNIESQFKSSYTIRIYEILDSYIGLENWKKNKENKKVSKTHQYIIGLEKLKWVTGVIYVDDNHIEDSKKKESKIIKKEIDDLLNKCQTDADYDRISRKYEAWLSPTGKRWDFTKKRIIEAAINELNSKEELIGKHYSYEPIKEGKKIKAIKFIIDELDLYDEESDSDIVVVNDEEKNAAINEIRNILNRNNLYSSAITDSQCFILAKKVKYDYERFSNVYDAFLEYAESQIQGIGNPVGLLINMIKNNAEPNKGVTYKAYIDSETAPVENKIKAIKDIIKENNYDINSLSEKDIADIEKYKKYILINYGISSLGAEKVSPAQLCMLLKNISMTVNAIFENEDSGQMKMRLE